MAPKSASVNAITERKASAKSSKRMKQIFVGKVFSFSGDFGENWGHEQMANWIRAHGGRYEREVSDDTTHLICTVEHYMLKTVQVKMAQNLGTQCHIVVKDWLEDCLIGHAMQKRCRVETPYTLTQVLKRVGSTRDRQYEYRQKFEQGVNASNELVDNRLNHIYYDETGFEYKIVCTRVNSDGKVKSERYVIYLFESNATPCHYMAGAKLTSHGRPASYWRTECHPKIFRDAFCDFMGWFKHVTGIDWDNRLDNLPPGPNKFRYIPPEPGHPVGSLPYEKRHLLLERNGDDEKDGTVGETPSKSDSKDDAESEKSLRRSYLSCSHISKSNCRSNLGNGSQLAWR